MKNNLGKNVMNFNDSRQNSQPPIQMHNFRPMPSSSAQIDHEQSEAERRASFVDQMKMESFWRERLSEIYDTPTDVRTPHTLPLARIKKVMKSDENVKMISADTPVVFAKACEIFVMELMLRAWMHAQHNKRKTLQRDDIAHAIRDEHLLAFLSNMVPVESDDHVHHHHQAADHDVANPINNHDGVYVPLPVMPPPNYPMYSHSINTQTEVAAEPMAPHDHHQIQMAFPMNLQHHSPNPGYSGRNRGMQQNPTFPPSSSSDDGPNPYHSFKEYFQ